MSRGLGPHLPDRPRVGEEPQARIRRLTQVLWVSSALNILLLGAFIYCFCNPQGIPGGLELNLSYGSEKIPRLENPHSNAAVLKQFRNFSYKQLLHKLRDSQVVEDGVTRRALALACLVGEHHFNLEAALGGLPSLQKTISMNEWKGAAEDCFVVFPGVADWQYRQILRYAHTKSWPFTNKGLFTLLQEAEVGEVPALRRAFYHTPEFQAAEALLRHSDAEVRRQDQLSMILDGNWEVLEDLYRRQKRAEDLSAECRRDFLCQYIELGAPSAAFLLLRTDFDYAVKELDNSQAILLLEQLTDPTPEAEAYALSMLTSPREEGVWEMAAQRLYEIADEEMPKYYNHLDALRHFAPEIAMSYSTTLLDELENRTEPSFGGVKVHQVAQGESLWRIASRYGVSVEDVRDLNQLHSDSLHAGDLLWIPE